MKLIIDIPEDMLEWFKNGEIIDEYDKSALNQVFKNGTLLPKDHGRLIDCDRLQEVFHKNVAGAEAFDNLFEVAPTIIEADKESL